MADRLPVLCIVGPTATGKSELGVKVAKAVGGEVISADSMQVYRGMDIGTAKLTPSEMDGVKHHLIDVVDPDQPFSVAAWAERARDVVDGLHRQGRLPVVVGGTGLYIRALTDDLDFANQPGSTWVRERWLAFAEAHGPLALHQELERRDPDSARRLHPHDIRRIVRALEVYELSRKRLSSSYEWEPRTGRYDCALFGLHMERQALYRRVEARIDRMVERGLCEEVRALLAKGYGRSLTSMQAIGYKEMAAYLEGEISFEEAVARIKQATRRFVKRQLSWFRRDPRIQWLQVNADGRLPDVAFQRILQAAREAAAGIPSLRRE
ncbi:MAG: tRNA (adenosine(37)-N6)-dimethylallyltransferase MiaA [Alicyclobacillaceae bacterium]|nr:tRNA (adenosine(37)-N6)-dimethylallyltransferase MiaA [Alicyclobacillaceae bacterium]